MWRLNKVWNMDFVDDNEILAVKNNIASQHF